MKFCVICLKEKAQLKRPKTSQQLCRECFYRVFETEIHNTIIDNRLFCYGDKVAIGASGGKGIVDSIHINPLIVQYYSNT